MTDAVRFSVDRATREVLEQFSDTLDREPNWVREFQTTFRKERENAQNEAQKHNRQVMDGLADLLAKMKDSAEAAMAILTALETRSEDTGTAIGQNRIAAEAAQVMLTTQIDALQQYLTEVNKQQAVKTIDLSDALGRIQVTLTATMSNIERQQEQIETLTATIQKISRPWWKNIFGG